MSEQKSIAERRAAYVQDLIDGKLPGSEGLVENIERIILQRRPRIIGDKILQRFSPEDLIRETAKRIYDSIDKLDRRSPHKAEVAITDFNNPEFAVTMIQREAGKVTADIYFDGRHYER